MMKGSNTGREKQAQTDKRKKPEEERWVRALQTLEEGSLQV